MTQGHTGDWRRHIRVPRVDPTHTQSLSLTHTISLSLTHNLSLSHTQSLSLSHTISLSLTHTISLSLSHNLSLSHTHSLSFSLSLTISVTVHAPHDLFEARDLEQTKEFLIKQQRLVQNDAPQKHWRNGVLGMRFSRMWVHLLFLVVSIAIPSACPQVVVFTL
jgi:outer membrane usher protein FimD/PapC